MPSRPARNHAKISPSSISIAATRVPSSDASPTAIADANKAIEVGRGAVSALMMGRLITLAAQQYSAAGDPKKAFELYQRLLRETSTQKGARGYLFGANRAIAGILIQMGDIAQAEAYLRRSQPFLQEGRTSGNPLLRAAYNTYGQNWEAEVETGRAMIFEARGQYPRRRDLVRRSPNCADVRRSSHCWAPRIRRPSPACCSLSISTS